MARNSKGLLSHVDPHMTLGQLTARLVREGLARHDPAAARAARRPPKAPSKLRRRRRRRSRFAALPRQRSRAAWPAAVPAAVKRAVWRRDRGRYVDRTSGPHCGSQHLPQIDHVVPYARGGGDEPNNLRLRCVAHHRYRHVGAGFDRPGEDRQAPVDR